jgi:hypothetical protein
MLQCLLNPEHGLQHVIKVTSELPAVLFLACGCFRARCANLTTAEGLPVETRLECTELDHSLRVLTGLGDSVGG